MFTFTCSPLPPLIVYNIFEQVGRSVDETLRLVQAFQYTDHKGEGMRVSVCVHNYSVCVCFKTLLCVFVSPTVCPAGWKPGEMTVS